MESVCRDDARNASANRATYDDDKSKTTATTSDVIMSCVFVCFVRRRRTEHNDDEDDNNKNVVRVADRMGSQEGVAKPAAPYPPVSSWPTPPGASGAEKRENPPGRSGGVGVIAWSAGQGSSGEWAPRDGPARDAIPQPRLRNDGGLASIADGMAPILGRFDAHSPDFAPIVQIDKSRLLLRGSYMLHRC